MSNRVKDTNGFLKVANCRFIKEAVNDYRGSEIPSYLELGLDPERVYKVYRPWEEIEKAADSFTGLPVLNKHIAIDAETMATDEYKKLICGNLGTDIEHEKPYLKTTITFTDGRAISEIEMDQYNEYESIKQLSPSYKYTPVVQPGEFNGQSYDIIMTEIKGNHVMRCPEGRQGADICVADQSLDTKENKKMAFNPKDMVKKLIKNLRKSKNLAFDESIIEREAEQLQEVAAMALNAIEEGDETAAEAALINMVEGLQDIADAASIENSSEDSAKDETPHTRLMRLLDYIEDDARKAEAVELLNSMVSGDSKQAMDSKQISELVHKEASDLVQQYKNQVDAKIKAIEEVRPLVGNIPTHTFDSAEDVYSYALKARNYEVEGKSLETLQTMVMMEKNAVPRTNQSIAKDSKDDPFMAELDKKLKKEGK